MVLDPQDNDHVLMAHPFASVLLGFSVRGRTHCGGVAAPGTRSPCPICSGTEPDLLVATRCPACDAAHAWVVGRDGLPPGDQVAHFPVPMRRAWDDVVRTCANQRLFWSTDCVDTWLHRTGQERGHGMDLSTLWWFASDWYTGRLKPGYTRRDPRRHRPLRRGRPARTRLGLDG